jgi:hypothetical protein
MVNIKKFLLYKQPWKKYRLLSVSKIRQRGVQKVYNDISLGKMINTKNDPAEGTNLRKLLISSALKIRYKGVKKNLAHCRKNITQNFPCYKDFHFEQLKISLRCIIEKLIYF